MWKRAKRLFQWLHWKAGVVATAERRGTAKPGDDVLLWNHYSGLEAGVIKHVEGGRACVEVQTLYAVHTFWTELSKLAFTEKYD
jgi:hypothetical protein